MSCLVALCRSQLSTRQVVLLLLHGSVRWSCRSGSLAHLCSGLRSRFCCPRLGVGVCQLSLVFGLVVPCGQHLRRCPHRGGALLHHVGCPTLAALPSASCSLGWCVVVLKPELSTLHQPSCHRFVTMLSRWWPPSLTTFALGSESLELRPGSAIVSRSSPPSPNSLFHCLWIVDRRHCFISVGRCQASTCRRR